MDHMVLVLCYLWVEILWGLQYLLLLKMAWSMKFINNQFMKVENIAQLVPRYLYLKDTRLLFVHCFLLDLKTVRISAMIWYKGQQQTYFWNSCRIIFWMRKSRGASKYFLKYSYLFSIFFIRKLKWAGSLKIFLVILNPTRKSSIFPVWKCCWITYRARPHLESIMCRHITPTTDPANSRLKMEKLCYK